ncbi:Uncharacterised protein [uncultured archaeon]|nr:Uncharacterised protein [uncultured archaeon]
MIALKTKAICMGVFLALMVSAASADMPMSFYKSMNNQKYKDELFVKNYDAGASVTESYSDAEHLQKQTEVKTASYDAPCAGGQSGGAGSLEASINSNVIGKAHIAWESVDNKTDGKGHPAVLGRSVEDLVGVFTIQKFIQLWSNSTPGEISIDWMPCI